jgi:hypothetical protein
VALPRKNTRSINIDGIAFQWAISSRAQPETGRIRLFVKSQNGGDKGILVYVPCRDFWLDISDSGLDPSNYRPLKPSDVRAIIVAAIKADWEPGITRKQLTFDYDWKQLTLRKT